MRQTNNIQRAVRTALGQAKGTTVPIPAKPIWQVTTGSRPVPQTAPKDLVTTMYTPTPPPGQPELQRHPQQQQKPELQPHPRMQRTPNQPQDIITSFPVPPQYTTQVVPNGGGYTPVPPCGPSPCCRQYDWQWWNSAKI